MNSGVWLKNPARGESAGIGLAAGPLVSPSKFSTAFTLTELLIVIVMLSVLGVLALSARPAPGSAGPLAQCLNNVRQLCQATRMYAADHQEVLPYSNWGSSLPGWLYTPISGSPPSPLSPDPMAAYRSGQLWQYIGDIAVYRCPTDSTNDLSWAARPNRLSTYVMNGAVSGFRSASSNKVSQFRLPGSVIFWEPRGIFSYNDGAAYPYVSEGPNKRHITGCVIGCLDGHAQFLRYTDALPLLQSSTANEFWCNPGSANGH